MSRFLPSTPFRYWPAFAWIILAAASVGARADAPADAVAEDPVKQLAFIEQHRYLTGVIDGIESPYDLEVSPDGAQVYVASMKNDAITYFGRDAASGALVYGGSVDQIALGENALDGARSLVFSPDGEFVYAVSMFSDNLVAMARDATSGSLRFVDAIYDNDAGVDGLDGARAIAMSPDGKHLYVAAYNDSKLSVFSRNATSGAPSFLGVYAEGDQGVEEFSEPHAVAASPDGAHLYVALWSNQIVAFKRASGTGLLNYVGKVGYLNGTLKPTSPRDLALSPDGKFLYVASLNNDALSVFARDAESGELSLVDEVFNSDTGVSDLDGPHALTISGDGKYLYVASFSSDSVTSFERDLETGELSYFQSIRSAAEDSWDMNGPISIGVSPDGEHVYVGTGSGTHSVVAFRRELLVDPPEFVVQPVSQSIEEQESAAFYALAQGEGLSYQWLRNGEALAGKTLPVLTFASVQPGDDGSVYHVEVSNAGGTVASVEAQLTVLPPVTVEAPRDLTALAVSSSSARLAWTDQSDNETSFEIQRRVPGGAFAPLATVLADREQYDDTSLKASTTYYYRARAKRNDAVSQWSNDAVMESFDDAPQAPVNLQVEEEAYNRVFLRWSDRSAVEDGFQVYRRASQVGSDWELLATVDRNATRYEDRSVAPLDAYAYRVRAYNESGASDYSNSVVGITGEIPVESISPTSRSIPRDAVSGYAIAVNSTKDWEAISESAWLVVTSPSGGRGSGSQGVSYRALLNESQTQRVGRIVVGGIEHTVTQAGSPPFLRARPSRTQATAEGGPVVVGVESNVDWTASESSDWVSIVSGQSGSNYGSVVVELQANETFETRLAELRINETSHVIEQAGRVAQLEIELDPERFAASGGSGTVRTLANVDWQASVSADWISIVGNASGSGDGFFEIAVTAYDGLEPRTADILVNDQAISVTQDGPVASDVAEPEWARVTVGELGAELEWVDHADDELGFRLRRRIAGTERYRLVAEFGPNETQFFDRSAPRGTTVSYQLVAFDAIGESDPVTTTSERLPDANFAVAAVWIEASGSAGLGFAGGPIAGEGEILLERSGMGLPWETLSLGVPYPVSRYKTRTDAGELELLGSGDWWDAATAFDAEAILAADGKTMPRRGLRYASWQPEGSRAFPRGARGLGELLGPNSAFAAGFEIVGEMPLPVIAQGRGPSLSALGLSGAEAVELKLYRLSESGGEPELLAENRDWRAWDQQAAITVEDARERTGLSERLDEAGGDALMLLMLEAGRYLVVMSGRDGATGAATLEVMDAR